MAALPHRVSAARRPQFNRQDDSGSHLTLTDDGVFVVRQKFPIRLKTRTHQCRDVCPGSSGCWGPTGALSRVGQSEWEAGLQRYRSKRLIIFERVHRCRRAERMFVCAGVKL